MKHSLLICDAEELALVGLAHLAKEQAHFVHVKTVSGVEDLQKSLHSSEFQLLVIDYQHLSESSDDLLIQIASEYPALKIMVISADNQAERILKVLEAGVLAFVTKQCSAEEINTAMRFAAKGQKFFCNKIMDLILQQRGIQKLDHSNELLTEKELSIIQMISDGYSSYEIADRSNLSLHTINAYRKIILKKLEVPGPVEMVAKAFRLGLIH